MSHSKFPLTTHPHTPTAVFDGDGRRIIDQWVAPEGWLPIETAPRGTPDVAREWIQLLLPDGRSVTGSPSWHNIWGAENKGGGHSVSAVVFGGYCEVTGDAIIPRRPTHWMPLPAPPSDAPAPPPLDPDTAAANAVMIAAIPQMISALEFVRDGYARNDVSHASYRVQVYEVALDVLASIGRTL